MEKKTMSLLLKSALSVSLLMPSIRARAADGVDGVEFLPVPVNVADNCSAMILKGTNRFRGIAFKMPRVILGVNKTLQDLFEIIPKGDGKYTLRVGLYFPTKEEAIDLRRDRSQLFVNTCRDDLILADINEFDRRAADRATQDPDRLKSSKKLTTEVKEDEKIYKLSPLPLAGMEVSIEGFQNLTFKKGESQGNLLNYQNQDIIANFEIPDKATYTEIKDQLAGMGLSLNIKMFFTARSMNGRAKIRINIKNIADSLEAAAKAAIGDRGDVNKTPVAIADLKTYMARAISKQRATIDIEQGDDPDFNKSMYTIIESMVAQMPAIPQLPQQVYDPNQQNGGWPSTWPGTTPTTNGSLQGPRPISVGPQARQNLKPADGTDPRAVYLGAALDVLRQQMNIDMDINNMGKREQQTYTTTVIINGAIPDPGFNTLNPIAGDNEGSAFTNEIEKGDELIIKIPSKRKRLTVIKKQKQLLSRDDVRTQGFSTYFGNLQKAISTNVLTEIVDRENGGYVAFYREKSDYGWIGRTWHGWWKENMPSYRWGAIEPKVTTSMTRSKEVELNADALKTLPLEIMFSESGKRFRLTDLAKETSAWIGKLDEEDNVITLTAKRRLGIMRVFNKEKPTKAGPSSNDRYIFEMREPDERKDLPDGKTLAEVRQYTWFKLSSTPGTKAWEKVGEPNTEPNQSERSVYAVKVQRKAAPEAPAAPGAAPATPSAPGSVEQVVVTPPTVAPAPPAAPAAGGGTGGGSVVVPVTPGEDQ